MDVFLDVRCWAAGAGAALGEYLGSFDSLLYALVAFIVTDYVTGVLCAIVEKRLSSSVGFNGICQKVFIMALVGGGCVLRTAVIFFYCANEGISIVENAARIGLPVPDKLTEVMKQLKNK